MQAVVDKVKLDPKEVADIVVGTVLAPGSQRANECRMAAFYAGFPGTFISLAHMISSSVNHTLVSCSLKQYFMHRNCSCSNCEPAVFIWPSSSCWCCCCYKSWVLWHRYDYLCYLVVECISAWTPALIMSKLLQASGLDWRPCLWIKLLGTDP